MGELPATSGIQFVQDNTRVIVTAAMGKLLESVTVEISVVPVAAHHIVISEYVVVRLSAAAPVTTPTGPPVVAEAVLAGEVGVPAPQNVAAVFSPATTTVQV